MIILRKLPVGGYLMRNPEKKTLHGKIVFGSTITVLHKATRITSMCSVYLLFSNLETIENMKRTIFRDITLCIMLKVDLQL
jgi:hypothetical protein